MFSWPHFGVKVIAIIHCYSKREWVGPRLLQIQTDPNKHSVLGELKTLASAGLFSGVEHFHAQFPGWVHWGNCSRFKQTCRRTRGLISTNTHFLTTGAHLAKKVWQVRCSSPPNHPVFSRTLAPPPKQAH